MIFDVDFLIFPEKNDSIGTQFCHFFWWPWETKKKGCCPFLTRWIVWHQSWKSKSRRSFHRLLRTLHRWMWPIRKSCVWPVHFSAFQHFAKALRVGMWWRFLSQEFQESKDFDVLEPFLAWRVLEKNLDTSHPLQWPCCTVLWLFDGYFDGDFSSVLEFSLALTVDLLGSHFLLGVCPRALSSPLW